MILHVWSYRHWTIAENVGCRDTVTDIRRPRQESEGTKAGRFELAATKGRTGIVG